VARSQCYICSKTGPIGTLAKICRRFGQELVLYPRQVIDIKVSHSQVLYAFYEMIWQLSSIGRNIFQTADIGYKSSSSSISFHRCIKSVKIHSIMYIVQMKYVLGLVWVKEKRSLTLNLPAPTTVGACINP